MRDFDRSLSSVVTKEEGLRPLLPILQRLPHAVEAQLPVEVCSVISTKVFEKSPFSNQQLVVRLLALRGYGPDQAKEHWRVIRAFEVPVERMLLMPADELLRQFGPIYGPLLADTLVNPKHNPILHALLLPPDYGAELREARTQRQPCEVVAEADLPSLLLEMVQERASGAAQWAHEVRFNALLQRDLDLDMAHHFHYQSTGRRLETAVQLYFSSMFQYRGRP